MRKFAIVAACLLALSAQAQKKAPAWPAEPTAIFGIPIGEKFENDRIRECGGVMAETEKSLVSACARMRPGFGSILIAGFPVAVFEEGFIGREQGVVETVLLHGNQSNYEGIKALMIERYGKPQKVSTEKLQSRMGAVFTSEVLYWEGKRVALTLHERLEKVDRTTAVFTSLDQAVKQMNRQDKTLKESASKM